MRKYLILLVFLLVSCSRTELMDDYVTDEIEPNSATYEANEIEEGQVYRGKIDKPEEDEGADTDLFKIWKPAGTLIKFVFESESDDFQFYVGHSDIAGHGEFVVADAPGKFEAEFITSVDGWQYFEIGDRRNTSEEENFLSGFIYYFRFSSTHLCDREFDELRSGEKKTLTFDNSDSKSLLFSPVIEENGYFQLDIDSVNMLTDKAMFILNCDSGEPVAGNDDESYYDNLLDPLIYSTFTRDGNYLGVVTRLLSDLRNSGSEEFSLSLKKQSKNEELESNNFYNYANMTGFEEVDGTLKKTSDLPDTDWFRFNTFKGQIINVDVTAGEGESFDGQIWTGSYTVTGSTIIPLRFSRLSSENTHHLNMLMPFSGSVYLMLEGDDLQYDFSVTKTDEIKNLLSFNGKVSETLETTDCKWDFYKWNMPETGSVFEINALGKTSAAGFHVFSSDLLPYAFVEPSENTRFFVHRYSKTEELTLGLYYKSCDQNSDNSMVLHIFPVEENFHKWENGYSEDPVIYDGDGIYQGFIDTDNYFIENSFDIEVPRDGTLYLTTAPGGNMLKYGIDTVISLYKGPYFVIDNDEMIDFLNFNRYSRLTWDVKKGEKYTVKVSPYMTESSNIEAMNVTGNYILDIRIK